MTGQDAAPINGALLRRQREARGWSLSDVATRACMSIKQIRQIEDGGLSAFYSEAVKQTAARKVGAILGISPETLFESDAVVTPAVTELSFVTAHEAAELLALSEGEASEPVDAAQTHAAEAEAAPDVVVSTADASPPSAEPVETSPAPGRTKNSWGLIAVLFVGAIALAASMRPSQEPPAAVDPPPALTPALQDGPPEPAASSATSTADGSAVAPAEAAAVAAPVQATPKASPAPAEAAAQAKPN